MSKSEALKSAHPLFANLQLVQLEQLAPDLPQHSCAGRRERTRAA